MKDSRVLRRFKLDPNDTPDPVWGEPDTMAIAWTDKNGDTWVEIRESRQGPLRPPEERQRGGNAA